MNAASRAAAPNTVPVALPGRAAPIVVGSTTESPALRDETAGAQWRTFEVVAGCEAGVSIRRLVR